MNRRARTSRRLLSSLLSVALVPVALAIAPSATAVSTRPAPHPPGGLSAAPLDPLLDVPRRGERAIRALGDDLATAAARNDMRAGEFRTLLRSDDTVWVDTAGRVYYVDPVPQGTPSPAPSSSSEAEATAPLEETFRLHSKPDADLTILLDFDGQYISGTSWNIGSYGVPAGTHPAWDPANDGPGFSETERRMVQQVWAIVAEDFAPFNVDVTTQDPGTAGLVRSSTADPVYGARVLITPSDDPHQVICGGECGGVAYLDVYGRVQSTAQPAWVFPQALQNHPKSIAEAASHEAGHNLGLDHDATSTAPYYEGHGDWAPIMGVGYRRPISQWSRGSYPGANNPESDLSILTGYLGTRTDEAPSAPGAAVPPPAGTAYVTSAADVDAYLLGACATGASIDIAPAALAPNLDVRAVLYDATGAQRAVAEPTSGRGDGLTASGMGAALTVPATGNGWVVTVEGAGQGSWTTQGYDDYGSLGAYTVSAPDCGGELVPGVPGAPLDIEAVEAGADGLTLVWNAPTDEGDSPVTGYVVSRSGSTATQTLGADARSHTFTGLTPNTEYVLSVRAVNDDGTGPAATARATTSGTTIRVPGAPAAVFATSSDRSVVVGWTAAASNGSPIIDYRVTVRGGVEERMVTVGGGHHSATVGDLVNGTAYTFVVQARNAVGWGPVSSVSNEATPAGPPTAPTNVRGAPGDGSATITWSPGLANGAPIDRYVVTASPGGRTCSAITTSRCTVSGLTNGTAYTFTVYAENEAGMGFVSVPSAPVVPSASSTDPGTQPPGTQPPGTQPPGTQPPGTKPPGTKPPGTQPPGTQPGPQTPGTQTPSTMRKPKVKVKGRKIVLRWTAAVANGSQVTGYLVDFSPNKRAKDRRLKAKARKLVLKKLKPGRYKVRIAAVSAAGTSSYTGWVKFRIR